MYKDLFFKDGYKVSWSFHTAMDLDKAIIYHFIELLTCDDKTDEKKKQTAVSDYLQQYEQNIAFFYDGNKILSNTLNNWGKICSQDITPLIHKLNVNNCMNKKRTFHAKISFVCFERKNANEDEATSVQTKNVYRIGVYSRNLTHSNSVLDVGGIYDIVFDDSKEENPIPKQNGAHFTAFLDTLISSCDCKGQEWLKEKDLTKDKPLYNKLKDGFELIDIVSGKEVEIFFGGVGRGELYKYIGIEYIDRDKSIILTPPAFICSTQIDQKESPCVSFLIGDNKGSVLYDLDKEKANNSSNKDFSTSHAKAYLIKSDSNPPEYRFLFGSANATPRGIGWNIITAKSSNIGDTASVECLIRYILTEEEFESLSKDINGYYSKYTQKQPEQPNEQDNVLDDRIGEFLSRQKVTEVNVNKDDKGTILNFIITVNNEEDKKSVNDLLGEQFPFYPLEYGIEQEIELQLTEEEPKNIMLTYKVEGERKKAQGERKKAQGELIVGKSKRVLEVPLELYHEKGLDTVKSIESIYDIFLTRAMDEENPYKYLEKTIGELEKHTNKNCSNDNKLIDNIICDMKELMKIFKEEKSNK